MHGVNSDGYDVGCYCCHFFDEMVHLEMEVYCLVAQMHTIFVEPELVLGG